MCPDACQGGTWPLNYEPWVACHHTPAKVHTWRYEWLPSGGRLSDRNGPPLARRPVSRAASLWGRDTWAHASIYGRIGATQRREVGRKGFSTFQYIGVLHGPAGQFVLLTAGTGRIWRSCLVGMRTTRWCWVWGACQGARSMHGGETSMAQPEHALNCSKVVESKNWPNGSVPTTNTVS